MQWFVDGWSPSYGASLDGAGDGSGPSGTSSASVDTDVELPAASWSPRGVPADVRAPDVVLLVDGVRRIDATLWSREPDGTSFAGLAASYAAGVVRCDLRNGRASLAERAVQRGLFTASPSAADLHSGDIHYPVRPVQRGGLEQLPAAIQAPLTALEVDVSTKARLSGDELLVVDGPLRSRRELDRTIGYIKSQQRQYLPPDLTAVVTALAAGQRTPVFRLGTQWDSYSWYLRLPGPVGAPWAGIVRIECTIECTPADAIALADVSAATLPRFASTPYKDPRAPQNLTPIAGLERRLRGLLGDSRLLHRALATCASR